MSHASVNATGHALTALCLSRVTWSRYLSIHPQTGQQLARNMDYKFRDDDDDDDDGDLPRNATL